MKEVVLVLIHGYPFDHTMWYATVAALGSGIRALLPDMPGFGSVPVLRERPSIEGYADYLQAYLKDNNVERAIIAGMSMGGYIALAFAKKYPETTVGLGLISTQAAADTDEAREGRARMITRLQSEGVQAAVAATLPKMFAAANDGKSELSRFPIEGAQKAGVEGLCWALAAMADRADQTEFLAAFAKPTLLVHGAEDKFIPFARARALGDQLLDPIFATVPNAGHATPLENPDVVASGLRKLVSHVRETLGEPAPKRP